MIHAIKCHIALNSSQFTGNSHLFLTISYPNAEWIELSDSIDESKWKYNEFCRN